MQYDFEAVKTWFGPSKLPYLDGKLWYDHKYLFVPVHLHDQFHWISIWLDLENKTVSCYDSLRHDSTSQVT